MTRLDLIRQRARALSRPVAMPGSRGLPESLLRRKRNAAARRRARRPKGCCYTCVSRPARPGRALCEHCAERKATSAKRKRQAKREAVS